MELPAIEPEDAIKDLLDKHSRQGFYRFIFFVFNEIYKFNCYRW
jgi:hypothetical protein